MLKTKSNILSLKPVKNDNTYSKYGYTFWYNLNVNFGKGKVLISTLSTESSLNTVTIYNIICHFSIHIFTALKWQTIL
jgi:hypothetical protein